MTTEQQAADLLEASSIRYGVWLRLAVLSSGRWAVYYSTEPGGGKETGVIEVFESLDQEYLRILSVNEQAKAEEQRARQLESLQYEMLDEPQISANNLEEMGL